MTSIGTTTSSVTSGVDKERADAGRDIGICLARLNPEARAGTGQVIHFPCSPNHNQDWQPYTVGWCTYCRIS